MPGNETQLTIEQALNLALEHHHAGRLAEAEIIYRKILFHQPNHGDSLHLLGLIAHQMGKNQLAEELIGRAIAISSIQAGYHHSMGMVLRVQGRFNQAAAAFHRALDLKPDYVQAYFNLGSTLRISGRVDEAIVAYRAALKIKPDYAEAHNNLGNALQIQGHFETAIAEYRLALQFMPDLAEAYNNMGSALHHIGQIEAAVTACTRAIEIKPDYIDAYNNLGNALQARGQLDEAAITYRKILQLKPDYAEAYNNLGITLIELGQLNEAINAFDAALKIKPEYAEAHNNRGHALKDMGRHDSAAAAYQNALKLRPDYADAHSNLLLEMHYHPDCQAKEIYQESLQWNRLHVEPLKNNLSCHMNNRDPNRRLKVGYVSGDLRKHPVGYFIENLFSQHDSSEVEIFCYADQYHKDEISRRLQGYAHRWENISGKKNELVAQMIREDQIDILVDLAGHTAHNRLLVFALKPAPLQVTYLGYPDTTGLSTMDYRFTDAYADPPGMSDEYNVETLVRLNPTFICYRPLDNMPTAGPPPVIKNSGKITFGSFNALMKINMRIVAVWSQILQRLPESRMLIKSHGLSDAAARQSLLAMFASYGIDPMRLDLKGKIPSMTEHLELYNQIDIALDTFPYHGTTTTCEALWMGVPVITLAGRMHMSRVGVSLLSNMALTKFIAQTPDEYVQIAVQLSEDLSGLKNLRSTSRQRMRESPLMDAKSFARNVETAYRNMWRKWITQPQV